MHVCRGVFVVGAGRIPVVVDLMGEEEGEGLPLNPNDKMNTRQSQSANYLRRHIRAEEMTGISARCQFAPGPLASFSKKRIADGAGRVMLISVIILPVYKVDDSFLFFFSSCLNRVRVKVRVPIPRPPLER